MFLGPLILLLAAAADRPFADERHLLDGRLETLRRILPDTSNPMADAAMVREMALNAKLTTVEALARPPVESGNRADVPVDVTAAGRFAEVQRFFAQLALSHRLIDVENLSLTSTPDDIVRLTAVVHVPYWPAKAVLTIAPDGSRRRTSGLPKAQADAFVRDQALAVAKTEAIAALRRAKRNPRLFLSELAAVTRDRPATVSFASLGDDLLIRGLTVGEGPVRALQSRFEGGFFRLSDFLVKRQGSCLQFEVRGKSPVAGPDADLPLPADDPFDQDDSPCRVDRDVGRPAVVKGPGGKTPGKGPLTLRLRDVDVADVFRVLHLLTQQGFFVDGDVTGRLSVDFSGVTLEEALAALQKWGLRISEPASIRRVSLPRAAAPTPLTLRGGATMASFQLKRAELRELLAVMTDLDPTLAALGPQGSLGKASVWVTDVALLDLRAVVLAAAGLTERVEDDRRLLERTPGAEENLVPVAGQTPARRLVLRAQDLAVSEFELAGVAGTPDGGFRAYAYSPNGVLHVYRGGERLVDGAVKSVDSTDILLDTQDGPLRLVIPPLH